MRTQGEGPVMTEAEPGVMNPNQGADTRDGTREPIPEPIPDPIPELIPGLIPGS